MRHQIRRVAAEMGRDRPPQGAPASWVEQATVIAVTAGAAVDGNALCVVRWRGADVAAAYCQSYTPAVGHTVLVIAQPPAPPVVVGRVIGTPWED